MTDITTPVGRLVQGSMTPQHQKDMDTNQPLFENGQPVMGTFFSLAFPKVLPNGQPNAEWDQFHNVLKQTAAAAWPQLFPQGAAGPCVNPRFSWKVQDGDGHDQSGNSVAGKPGFAGHWIVKFFTSYPVRCYEEGKFAAHEELQEPDKTIKRGYWVRVIGETRSNNATGNQVPGISLYPKLVSFVAQGEEIASGPDAQQAFGAAPVGWRPPATNSPVPQPGQPAAAAGGLPTPPAVNVPTPAPAVNVPMPTPPAVNVPTPPPAAPSYQVSAALAAQNITIEMLLAQGWTHDALVANGHATKIG